MASRMDRYREPERQLRSRSANNQELYKRIYDNAEYTNIERVVTTPNANEVNIESIRKMISELENERNRRQIVKRDVEERKPIEVPQDNERSYDIRDVLSQAKSERPPEQKKYRSLKTEEFNILNNIDLPNKDNDKYDKIDELYKTLTNTKRLGELDDNELSLELFDDLKSNTSIEDSKSIKAIIDEELEKERERARIEKEQENGINSYQDLDNNFGFSSKDFAGNDDSSPKKGNKFLIVSVSFFATIAAIALIVWIVLQVIDS